MPMPLSERERVSFLFCLVRDIHGVRAVAHTVHKALHIVVILSLRLVDQACFFRDSLFLIFYLKAETDREGKIQGSGSVFHEFFYLA
jgi:hypothetical protein